ncbi:MAG: NAD-dependent epimerase/dehydratase family protein [Lawsonibacter sp.]|nr:NAD-dependent epimerase/dehydratase family protein [Lawsonibacter sp.]
MKILVLGGTGVISRQIVKQAVEKGYDVTIFNRGSRELPECAGAQVVLGDRKAADFADKFAGENYDTVIDMICFNENDARQTVEVFGGKAKQIIVTSSIAAYDRPYHSYPIREETEHLRTDPAFAYGYKKALLDGYLQSQMHHHPAAITVIRPSLTFGPGAANFGMLRQNRNLVRRIKEGKPVVMVGEGVIPRNFTFARDLAQAFVLACCNENTYNDVFHVTNSEIVMWEDLYRAAGKAVGKEPNMAYISSHLLREFMPSVCEHLNFEKVHFSVFSTEKFRRAVPEFNPTVGVDEGVKELVDWWESTDFPYDEERDALEDAVCGAYSKFEQTLVALTAKQ